MKFDAFISHASEDKVFVKKLADNLIDRGLSIWYDDYILKVGDSLKEEISKGLTNCRHGIIVLSKRFYEKPWPKAELNALFSLMMNNPNKRLLPLLYQMDLNELASKDPLLLDVKMIKADEFSVESIARQLIQAMVYHEEDVKKEGLTKYKHSSYSHNYYNSPEDIKRFGYKLPLPYELDLLEEQLRPREILMCYVDDVRGQKYKMSCHISCRERLRDFQRDFKEDLEMYAVEFSKLNGSFDNLFTDEEIRRINQVSN